MYPASWAAGRIALRSCSKPPGETVAIEVKLLSDLGAQQLERYHSAFPGMSVYRVLHLETLPVNLRDRPMGVVGMGGRSRCL